MERKKILEPTPSQCVDRWVEMYFEEKHRADVAEEALRKLTPKECWRLMGFDDSDFDKAKASGVSNSQLYKQAGNSIVVNVLEAIFKQIL